MPVKGQSSKGTDRGHRKIRIGIVTSNRMKKTIVVRVTRLVRHRSYSRVVHQTNSFKVHDEANSAGIGDWVRIMETRPLSKDKRWRLVEILKRAANLPSGEPDDLASLPESVRLKAPATEAETSREKA